MQLSECTVMHCVADGAGLGVGGMSCCITMCKSTVYVPF